MTLATRRISGYETPGYPLEVETNATLKIRFVDDLYVNMNDMSIDFLKYLGGPSQFTYNNTKVEWLIDETWNRRVSHGGLVAADTTSLTVTAYAYQLPIGTLLCHTSDGEVVRVTSITDANTVVLTRDVASAVAEGPWGATDEVIVCGLSMDEDAAWNMSSGGVKTLGYNYSQVMNEAIQVTFRRMETPLYGLKGTDLDDLTQNVVARNFVNIEEGLINGVRFYGVTGGANPAMFGGLNYYLGAANATTIVNLAGVAMVRKDLDDILQNLFYSVGPEKMARTCLVSAWAKRKISSWFSSAERMNSGAGQRAGVTVDAINTDFGPIDFMLHTSVAKNTMYFLNPANIKVGSFGQMGRPHLIDPAGVSRSGPYVERFYYADVSAEFKGLAGMGKLYNFSLTT
jgi:hypothetical protein